MKFNERIDKTSQTRSSVDLKKKITQDRKKKLKFSLSGGPLPDFLGVILILFNLVIPTAMVAKHLKGEIPGDILASNNTQSAIIVIILTILALVGIAVLLHNYNDDEIM